MVPIDEVVHFDVTTHRVDTGAVTDADSPPTFDVFEEATDTPILDDQAMTKRTSLTGDYRGSFTASAANGFEAGKWYSVVVTATVNSVTAKDVAKHFRVAPAESAAGVPKADVSTWDGTDVTTGVPLAPTVAGRTLDVSADGDAEANVTKFGGTAGVFASGLPTVNLNLDQDASGVFLGDTVGESLGFLDAAVTSRLAPTVAARTLDVSADGDAEANVTKWLGTAAATPTTAGVPEVDVTFWKGTAPEDLTFAGYVQAHVASMGGAVITSSVINANAFLDTHFDATVGTEIGTAVWATAARTLTALDEDSTTLDLDATVRAAVGLASANLDTQLGDLPTNAELATALGTADDAVLTAIAALNNVTAAQVATAVFTTAMTEAYRSAGATATLAQFVYEVIAHLGESSISGTTKTLKKLDGSTTAKVYTLDDATTPTSITETS
jgi:hypothetical protein